MILPILFGALATAGASLACGMLLLHYARTPFRGSERFPVAFVAGSAVNSLVIFAACATGGARKNLFLVFFAAVIIWAYRVCRWREPSSLEPLPRNWRIAYGVVYAGYALLYFLSAALPEYSPDGSSYHLGNVAHYVRAHGFVRIPTNMYAHLSQGVELLFLPAFALGRHSAAALVHCAFLLILPLLVLNYARRIGQPAAGLCASLLVMASPVFGKDGTSAYNDVAVAAAVLTVFYLVEAWRETGAPGLIPLAGLVAGFCYASKYTAFLAVPYGLYVIARKDFRWRPLAVFSMCAAASILPWMLKNWILVGNPVSPLLNSIFPNPYIYIAFEKDYTRMMRAYDGITSYWQIPLEVTLRGGYLAGFLGAGFVLAPLGLAALRSPQGRRILAAALVFGITYFGNIGTRFLIPAAPFAALALGLVLTRFTPALVFVTAVHVILSLPGFAPLYCAQYAWRLPWPDWRVALRLKPEEPFLATHLGVGYLAARAIDRVVPPSSPVLTLTPIPEAYTSRLMITGFQSAPGSDLIDMIEASVWTDFAPTAREFFQFQPAKASRLRIRQTGSGTDVWSLSEVRLYYQGKEIPRKPAWRVRSNVNPWGIQRAFDNALITRWRSGEAIRPGMFVEIDLGETVTIDRVVMETTHDHYQAKVQLDVFSGDRWKTVDDASDFDPLATVPGIRQAAAAELKAAGIRYLLVHDGDSAAEDFRKHTTEWQAQVVAEMPGALLYYFQ